MAASPSNPFPHVRINVKDNSIATINVVETLPVHRALYVMRTQEGPVGVPKWCNTYSEAVANFGAETFNPANGTYFSKAANFLLNTMTSNGAFITRYLPEGNSGAFYVLYARVLQNSAIQQYEYEDGERKLAFDADKQEWVEVKKTGDGATEPGVDIIFGTRALMPKELNMAPTADEVFLEGKNYYVVSGASYAKADTSALIGESIPADTYYDAVGPNVSAIKGNKLAASAYSEAGYEFPLFVFTAKYAGAYGNDLAIRLFYAPKANDPADVGAYNTLFYNIAFARRAVDQSSVDLVSDIYGRDSISFAANPDAINPDSGASLGIDFTLDKAFSDATHILPVDFYAFESSFKAIGAIIAAYENDLKTVDASGTITYTAAALNGFMDSMPVGALTADEKDAVKSVYFGTATDDQKALVEGIDLGYKVNCISLINLAGGVYDHVQMINSADGFEKANLNQASFFYLAGGSDGVFVDDNDSTGWASDDKAMFQFCKLKLPVLKDTIVESLHYPFTHIFDIGYSMKTKKAILDFLDVRDDFMAILSAQVLMSDGSGRSVADSFEALNDQAADEANIETLRAYALLMRESILFGTDCMRASIYAHAGILAAGSYGKPVPFTLWSAIQYAQYGNLTYMKTQEPRGLPYSYNQLFKRWNWNNYREDAQSRVWDNGGNYVQYADMTRLFYPSLRTVYRAATSVLVDEWFVAAVVYAKYVCKRAWARFSGRNDSAPVLQAAIKGYIDAELGTMFNSKYTFSCTAYQTAEELALGYVQHVRLSITSPATMRVLDVDIEVNREGFVAEE